MTIIMVKEPIDTGKMKTGLKSACCSWAHIFYNFLLARANLLGTILFIKRNTFYPLELNCSVMLSCGSLYVSVRALSKQIDDVGFIFSIIF